ncbi:hypothetical protein LZ32DRAFT_71324 [Colletotrichum eremochloae]|nr:hypothetical protein LZ32DRAFT_71324 [Colletotrichum eremochloae]
MRVQEQQQQQQQQQRQASIIVVSVSKAEEAATNNRHGGSKKKERLPSSSLSVRLLPSFPMPFVVLSVCLTCPLPRSVLATLPCFRLSTYW